MNLKRIWGKCLRGLDVIRLNAYATYSQAGEDRIVSYLFSSLNINKPTYLDIGTNEPVISNNTYMFYDRGSSGVCIEPDVAMFERIKRKRSRDVVLNIGIGINNSKGADFYLFPGKLNGWSTFSDEEARIREAESGVKAEVIIIPLQNINDIIEKYFNPWPNFISLDVEGMDLDILQSLDFARFKPEVICVETISFSITNTEEKLNDIIDFMHGKGYFTYGDTHINTIFCRKDLFRQA
jgi:FkbM family methyltransferase